MFCGAVPDFTPSPLSVRAAAVTRLRMSLVMSATSLSSSDPSTCILTAMDDEAVVLRELTEEPPDLALEESDCSWSSSANEIVTVSPSAVVTFNAPCCSTAASKSDACTPTLPEDATLAGVLWAHPVEAGEIIDEKYPMPLLVMKYLIGLNVECESDDFGWFAFGRAVSALAA